MVKFRKNRTIDYKFDKNEGNEAYYSLDKMFGWHRAFWEVKKIAKFFLQALVDYEDILTHHLCIIVWLKKNFSYFPTDKNYVFWFLFTGNAHIFSGKTMMNKSKRLKLFFLIYTCLLPTSA